MNRHQNKVTIVTAADDRYAPLLYELIRSIRDKPESAVVDISVIATGMSQAMAELFSGLADNLVDGYWTIKISRWRMRNRNGCRDELQNPTCQIIFLVMIPTCGLMPMPGLPTGARSN